MRLSYLASIAALSTLTACGGGMQSDVQPLQPQPTSPVAAQPLPPPATPEPAPVETAASQPMPDPATAIEIRRPQLSGGWTIASGGESCQLFMTLTTWSGGYRANTRGCASDELKSIGAWDLNGKEIILKDASGVQVARLYASSVTRFTGQTSTSRGVQVFRGQI